MQSEHTVQVTYVEHTAPQPCTDNDEAIARALAQDMAAVELAAAAPGASKGGEGHATAPPLPPDEEQELWHQQQPRALHPVQQLAADGPPYTDHPEAVSRYDEQLARSLQEQEVQELSRQERDRLSTLPGLLSVSAHVRTLSDKLQGLQGVSFEKLVPQVNSSIAAASAEPTSAGRARLKERLSLYCLIERQVKGDGSCQFRALSDQLYRTPRLHHFVRECVCQQLQQHPDWYAAYVPSGYHQYCADMARHGVWGDHVTLQAAADYFGVRIAVLSSYQDSCFLEIEPRKPRSSRVLWISFWAEVHYNSVYPSDEPPASLPDDKLFGSRRLHSLLFGATSPAKPSR